MDYIPATLEELNTLQRAYNTGARDVYYGDKRVSYRSLEDMLRIIDRMKAVLMPATNSRVGRRYASISKGLY